MMCKREGCDRPATPHRQYQGCCSLECRDLHECDEEIASLKAQLAEAREALPCFSCDMNVEFAPLTCSLKAPSHWNFSCYRRAAALQEEPK